MNSPPGPCADPVQNLGGPANAGCIPGDAAGGTANIIDSGYRTPYAIHISGGVQHAFTPSWSLGADYIHEQGNHAYRAYSYTGGTNLFTPQLPLNDPAQATYVPDVNVFHSDNRSSYNGLLIHLQGVSAICTNSDCTATEPITSLKQLGVPAGALGDFFGPGTTVGIPFAAQLGVRLSF